ncbi:MAG: CDGSH iron-sulfur domain-containing protein [Acidobacteria bacterium]|nr:CDGSH iron-sulfur domain-containing protein [Acidobacteriota bacterium]
MSDPVIAQRFPYVLELEPGNYFWCACGKSANQPYCDGSHKGSDFRPVLLEVTESRRVALCGCKHTGSQPLCDGSHKDVGQSSD